MCNKRRSFTLVELLVVIAIIAVLAGMLMAGIMYAPAKAQKAKAQAEITTLVNAIKQYESTYGVLPIPSGAQLKSFDNSNNEQNEPNGETKAEDGQLTETDYKRMIRILQGDNKRGTKFLDVQGNDEGEFLDPWGNCYKVVFDADYNGKIGLKNRFVPGVYVEEKLIKTANGNDQARYVYHYSVIVWSSGKDRKFQGGVESNKVSHSTNEDNVYSFPTTWSSSTGHNISK